MSVDPDFICIALIDAEHLSKAYIFEHGAVDYMTYPVHPREVEVRINAWMRYSYDLLPRQRLSRNEQLVVKAKKYQLQNIGNKHTIESVSNEIGSNRNSLAIAFREVVGCGVSSWLRKERMKRAKYYLESTSLSIEQIATLLGYDEPNNFSAAYKSIYSMSPLKHRRKMTKS